MKCVILLSVFAVAAYFIYRRLATLSIRKNVFDITKSLKKTRLPIIEFINNGKVFNFIVDTGATNSVLNKSALQEMEFNPTDFKGSFQDAHGNISEARYAVIELFKDGRRYSECFQLVDLSKAMDRFEKEDNIKIAGLLGNTFISGYDFVIDYKKMEVYNNN